MKLVCESTNTPLSIDKYGFLSCGEDFLQPTVQIKDNSIIQLVTNEENAHIPLRFWNLTWVKNCGPVSASTVLILKLTPIDKNRFVIERIDCPNSIRYRYLTFDEDYNRFGFYSDLEYAEVFRIEH